LNRPELIYGSAAFYARRSDGAYESLRATTGPWDTRLQHGGPPAALLAHTLHMLGGPKNSRIARIAFDFYGPVPVAKLGVAALVLRPGSRIQLSNAALTVEDRTVMRATAWHVRTESNRGLTVAAPFTVPPLPDRETVAQFPGAERFPYGDAVEWRFVSGSFMELGPATVWTRMRIPLIDDVPLTGLTQTLIAVDAANGISAVLPFTEWTFVPVELTVVMERHPMTEWIGMSASTSIHSDGIGITETLLFDNQGAFGRALQTLFVAPRGR
jgi:Thioesterase-like superfamily